MSLRMRQEFRLVGCWHKRFRFKVHGIWRSVRWPRAYYR